MAGDHRVGHSSRGRVGAVPCTSHSETANQPLEENNSGDHFRLPNCVSVQPLLMKHADWSDPFQFHSR